MQNHIRLDDLLSRNVNVQWFEGVALVQSACRHILDAGTVHQAFPAPSNIHLCHDGSVLVLGASSGGGVGDAVNLLAQMLSDDVPVRLRLAVSQATGTESSYGTLAEFSEALAYYERPDARQVLRHLYERAAMAGPGQERHRPIEAAATPEAAPVAVRPPTNSRRTNRAAVLAVTAAAMLCVAVALVGSGYGDTRIVAALDRLKGSFGPETETASTGAPGEPKTEPTKKTHAGKSAGATAKTTLSTDSGHQGRTTSGRDGAAQPRLISLPELSLLPRPVAQGSSLAGGFVAANAPTLVFRDAEPIVVIASTRGGRGTEMAGRVYSKADAVVTLPRNIYPKLPPDPPNVAAPDQRTILELLIATDGLVERVNLRTPPRDVHEFMLVSAAKAWRFEPATINGRPVRFLHRVAISSIP
jgi:hypothetical protein